jgi:hypothetical protein
MYKFLYKEGKLVDYDRDKNLHDDMYQYFKANEKVILKEIRNQNLNMGIDRDQHLLRKRTKKEFH